MVTLMVVGALVLGGFAGALACGLGRVARETDEVERAAWVRREALLRLAGPPR